MVGNERKFRILTWLSTLLLISAASAQNALPNRLEFSAKPNQCVALRKGQTCYQRVWLKFKAAETGDYCLHIETRQEPLKCWNNASTGKYRYELESSENVVFYLHNKAGRVADVEVNIAWVYKNKGRGRASWRLF